MESDLQVIPKTKNKNKKLLIIFFINLSILVLLIVLTFNQDFKSSKIESMVTEPIVNDDAVQTKASPLVREGFLISQDFQENFLSKIINCEIGQTYRLVSVGGGCSFHVRVKV